MLFRSPGITRALPPGLLELSPVERGVVSIFGVASRFFVAMSSRGRLYGSVSTVGPAEPGSIVTLPGHPTPGSWSCGGGRGTESNPRLLRQCRSPLSFSHSVLLDFFGDPVDPPLPGSPVHGISQARILE